MLVAFPHRQEDDCEDYNGSRKIIPASKLLAQPAGHRHEDHVGDGICGDDPGDLIQ